MADYSIKRANTSAAFTATVTDLAGNAVNLTGATVTFVARLLTSAKATVNAAATIVSGPAGTVSYTPTATDTAVAGEYMVEWQYTLAGGATGTFPVDGYLSLQVEEDLLSAPQRIVSLAEVKDHLRFTDSNRTRDARLVRLIDACTPVIEVITGPILVAQYEEWHDGGSYAIVLRHQPVVTLIAVSEYRGPVEYPLALVGDPAHGTVFSAMLDPTGRLVRRAPGGGIVPFLNMPDAVHVLYTAGFTTVPANVKEAALELVRINYDQTEQPGPSDEDHLGGPMLGMFVPNRVRELLVPNRRRPSIA